MSSRVFPVSVVGRLGSQLQAPSRSLSLCHELCECECASATLALAKPQQ